MRRRATRDLGTILGIVVILAGIVLAKGYMDRGSLTDQYEKVRKQAEIDRKGQGASLLQWDVLRKTTGTKRSGPTFDARLVQAKDQPASLIGFMVPLEEFHNIKNFLLLPVPIECYFCQMPPMRDVVLVQMGEGDGVDLVREPVLINGTLTLNEGPGTKFFYVMKDAALNAAKQGERLHRRQVRPEAIQHSAQSKDGAGAKEQLMQGEKPPVAAPGK